MSDGDGVTSAERNMLRVVERYSGPDGAPVTSGDAARGLGTSRQAVSAMAATLERAGYLAVTRLPKAITYAVTAPGLSYLGAHQSSFLLVEVDDRMADDVAYYLAQGVNGVQDVAVHNEEYPRGCCCQHCPHNGNCRD
jgi:hypothetical protein